MKPSRSNRARSRGRSGSLRSAASRSCGSGTSLRSVASCFESRACSACASSASRARFDVHLAGVRQQVLEVSPAPDQLGRSLGSDPRDPGDVVRRVSGQRAQVEQLGGRNAKAALDFLLVVAAVLHAVEQHHALAHQLHQVLVARDDRDPGVRGRPPHQRRDHVVGLEPGDLEDRDLEGLHQLARDRDLRREILGLRVAGRLVLRVELVAEVLPARVEDHQQVVGRLLADHLSEHRHEAVGGVGGSAVGGAQLRDREEGAVERVRAVDDDDARMLLHTKQSSRHCGYGAGGAGASESCGYGAGIARASAFARLRLAARFACGRSLTGERPLLNVTRWRPSRVADRPPSASSRASR